MQYTDRLNLKKPDGTDPVNIADINYNMDVIDSNIIRYATVTISSPNARNPLAADIQCTNTEGGYFEDAFAQAVEMLPKTTSLFKVIYHDKEYSTIETSGNRIEFNNKYIKDNNESIYQIINGEWFGDDNDITIFSLTPTNLADFTGSDSYTIYNDAACTNIFREPMGGKIKVTEGTFICTEDIIISNPNISLVGSGYGATTIKFLNEYGEILISGDYVKIENVKLVGEFDVSIRPYSADYVTIRDVVLESPLYSTIEIGNSSSWISPKNVYVENVRLYGDTSFISDEGTDTYVNAIWANDVRYDVGVTP